MSQFPHDQFAKDLLKTLLSPLGRVEADRKISWEVREIDACFLPNAVVIHQLPKTPDTLWLRVLGNLSQTNRSILWLKLNRLAATMPLG
ncbi:MAG: hypothetical protein KME17_30140 [Cyanosarcina radialis HA8281-LM2]|nr:hypothetical protein [Cyanosarcina radialis HA8281-LM2]